MYDGGPPLVSFIFANSKTARRSLLSSSDDFLAAERGFMFVLGLVLGIFPDILIYTVSI
jgi:hypothetical protein